MVCNLKNGVVYHLPRVMAYLPPLLMAKYATCVKLNKEEKRQMNIPRVPIPKAVLHYNCISWLQWFAKMYPDKCNVCMRGGPFSAAYELKCLDDPIYHKALRKYNRNKKGNCTTCKHKDEDCFSWNNCYRKTHK